MDERAHRPGVAPSFPQGVDLRAGTLLYLLEEVGHCFHGADGKGHRMAGRRATGLSAVLTDASILTALRGAGRLTPGSVPKRGVTVKAAEATRMLRTVIRFVADVPADSSPIVVWEQEGSELWVDISTVALTCIPGVIRVAVKVGCDQLPEPAVITVPFGVGTPEAPTGLVMSSLSRLDGPEVVTGRWTAALTAFGWEAVLELARRMCAELGSDAAGLPLIPGSIAAGSQILVVQPMARNDLSGLRR